MQLIMMMMWSLGASLTLTLTLSWTNLFMSMKMRLKSERRGQLQMRALGGATAFGGETLLMDHLKIGTWM